MVEPCLVRDHVQHRRGPGAMNPHMSADRAAVRYGHKVEFPLKVFIVLYAVAVAAIASHWLALILNLIFGPSTYEVGKSAKRRGGEYGKSIILLTSIFVALFFVSLWVVTMGDPGFIRSLVGALGGGLVAVGAIWEAISMRLKEKNHYEDEKSAHELSVALLAVGGVLLAVMPVHDLFFPPNLPV